jgi:hypothetical protein
MENKCTLIIEPYVTANGGVVILNGPFSINQANRIATLCKAAPDLLRACQAVLPFLETEDNRRIPGRGDCPLTAIVRKAIAEATGK